SSLDRFGFFLGCFGFGSLRRRAWCCRRRCPLGNRFPRTSKRKFASRLLETISIRSCSFRLRWALGSPSWLPCFMPRLIVRRCRENLIAHLHCRCRRIGCRRRLFVG